MHQPYSLADLFVHFPLKVLSEVPDLVINGITADFAPGYTWESFCSGQGRQF